MWFGEWAYETWGSVYSKEELLSKIPHVMWQWLQSEIITSEWYQ